MLFELKSRQSKWLRQRWYVFLAGVVIMTVGFWLVCAVYRRALTVSTWNAELIVACPMFFALFAQGIIMCTLTALKWRGDPVVTLLLKLLDGTSSTGGEEGSASS